jgi:hypothetical protein
MNRKHAIAAAQSHLIRVLKDSKFEDINVGSDSNDLYELLSDLRSSADEMKSLANGMIEDMSQANVYLSGGEGRFNSSGILQSSALRYDQLAAVFSVQVKYAKSALVNYYLAKQPGSDECDGCHKKAELYHCDATGESLCEACNDEAEGL